MMKPPNRSVILFIFYGIKLIKNSRARHSPLWAVEIKTASQRALFIC